VGTSSGHARVTSHNVHGYLGPDQRATCACEQPPNASRTHQPTPHMPMQAWHVAAVPPCALLSPQCLPSLLQPSKPPIPHAGVTRSCCSLPCAMLPAAVPDLPICHTHPTCRGDTQLLFRTAHGAALHPSRPATIVLFGGYGGGPSADWTWLNDLVLVHTDRCVCVGGGGGSGCVPRRVWLGGGGGG
jgi:hypothetical protein